METNQPLVRRLTLPVLPLRGTVIFPGLTAPIGVVRPGSLHAIEAAMKNGGLTFAVTQRDEESEPSPDKLHSMGVIARIGQVQRGLGGVQLLLQGERRAHALHYHEADGFFQADLTPVSEIEPIDLNDSAFSAMYREIRERAMELGERKGLPDEVLHHVLDPITDAGRFTDVVAGYLELPAPEKQSLLETLSVEEADAQGAGKKVRCQIGMLEAQAEIKSQVQEELGERQREMFLREQMKAIQKELGDDDGSREVTQLRDKLQALDLPRDARAEVERELGRLERSGRESMEAQVIRTYLEWVAELPWNTRSDDDLKLTHATAVLDEDHYGLQDVKDRVLEFLAVRQLRAEQLANEVLTTGELPAEKLKVENDTATPSLSNVHADEKAAITDPATAKARVMARGPILLFVGPPGASARRRSPNQSPARSAASTFGPRWAARVTRPISAATAGRTSGPCPAASSRG